MNEKVIATTQARDKEGLSLGNGEETAVFSHQTSKYEDAGREKEARQPQVCNLGDYSLQRCRNEQTVQEFCFCHGSGAGIKGFVRAGSCHLQLLGGSV